MSNDTASKYYGTGRRKTSVARVWLTSGTGNIVINDAPMEDYFPRATNRMVASQPLVLAEVEEKFDVRVNVRGGGHSGQADAVKHGIARALLQYDPDVRRPLKKAGFLTRDPRVKERKKYGQPGARKRFQYSKR